MTWSANSYNWQDYRETGPTWMDPFKGFICDQETFGEGFTPSQMVEEIPEFHLGYPQLLLDSPLNP